MSVRLDEDLYEALQAGAAREGRSLNNYVVWVLRLAEMADAGHPIDTDNDPPLLFPAPRIPRRVVQRRSGKADPIVLGEDIAARKKRKRIEKKGK
jgi:hypothetical protein